jgi:hypothetical protein
MRESDPLFRQIHLGLGWRGKRCERFSNLALFRLIECCPERGQDISIANGPPKNTGDYRVGRDKDQLEEAGYF